MRPGPDVTSIQAECHAARRNASQSVTVTSLPLASTGRTVTRPPIVFHDGAMCPIGRKSSRSSTFMCRMICLGSIAIAGIVQHPRLDPLWRYGAMCHEQASGIRASRSERSAFRRAALKRQPSRPAAWRQCARRRSPYRFHPFGPRAAIDNTRIRRRPAEHPDDHGRRYRLVQSEHLSPRHDGLSHAQHRPHRQ
ncbi:hypothetical protein D9M70_468780 [compost metagenome]